MFYGVWLCRIRIAIFKDVVETYRPAEMVAQAIYDGGRLENVWKKLL